MCEQSRQIWIQDGHSDLPLARRPQPTNPLNVTGIRASLLKLWQAELRLLSKCEEDILKDLFSVHLCET